MSKPCCVSECTEPRAPSSARCREHRNEYMRDYWTRPGGREKLRRKNFIRRGRHISFEDYTALKEAQNNRCAICDQPERAKTRTGTVRELNIDHCHAAGHVRGLLCSRCNTGLGLFLDNPSLLQRAIQYLGA